MNAENKKNYGPLAFAPLVIFILIYLGSGLYFLSIGTDRPFNQIPMLSAILVGVVIALAMNPKVSLDEKTKAFAEGASENGVLFMVLIFMFAGAFSAVSSAMGGVDSVVNLGVSYIPHKFLIPGIFIIAAFISTATGTCVGTAVTMAPIAQGIATAVSLNPALAMGAVLSGSMFGDNMSVISDTTIAATRGVGAEMKDKVRMNFKIALPAALAAIIAFSLAGGEGVPSTEILEYSLIKVIPYVAVLIASVAGASVLIVLISGSIVSALVGFATGSLTIIGFMQAVGTGMSGMFTVVIVALLVRGIIGIVRLNGGIDWLINAITSRIKSRKGAEYSIAVLVGTIAFTVLDNTVAILTAAPIVKTIGDQYGIAPKRMASLLDIFACVSLTIAPHTNMIVLLSTTAGVSPVDILQFAFYQVFLGIAAIITIQFGLLRTKEEKELDEKVAA